MHPTGIQVPRSVTQTGLSWGMFNLLSEGAIEAVRVHESCIYEFVGESKRLYTHTCHTSHTHTQVGSHFKRVPNTVPHIHKLKQT